MNIADLSDTSFSFKFEHAPCGDFWQYRMDIEKWDDKYYRHFRREEVATLLDNCRKMIEAFSDFKGGN